MKYSLLILCLSLVSFSCKENSKEAKESDTTFQNKKTLSTPETIAYKSGLEKWDNVQTIAFTFNVDRGENHFERSWQWKPKTDDVQLISEKDTIAFNRNKLDSTLTRYDASFVNDKYWLLAPFNLVWDEGTSFSEKENVIAPISKEKTHMLTVTYGNEGGYTPGDAYDFYYGDDFLIKEWTFRKGNQDEASMITTWEDYKQFNGIKIATMHQDSTKGFKLYFTGIKVE